MAIFSKEPEVIFRFMHEHKAQFPISVMCEVLSISRSSYYAWQNRPVSRRKQADTELLKKIRINRDSKQTYGKPGDPGGSRLPLQLKFCSGYFFTLKPSQG